MFLLDRTVVIHEDECISVVGVGVALGSFVARAQVAGLIIQRQCGLARCFLLASVTSIQMECAGILRYDARLTARAASYGEGILISSFLAMGCISDDLSRQVWLQAFCEAGAYPIDWMREQHLFLELGVVR